MADYPRSARWASDSTGTLLIPEFWVPAIEEDLPLYTMWPQFLAPTYGGVAVGGEGKGRWWKTSYVSDLSMSGTTALVAGTEIAAENSSALTQITGTLDPYGHAETVETFTDWLANVDMQRTSAIALAKNAMQVRNYLVGAQILANTTYFAITGTASVGFNTGNGSSGTSALLPIHITNIVSKLRSLGIPPFQDGLYRMVGPPYAFDSIKNQSQIYSSAAQLGIDGVYTMGDVFKYGGVLFVEEFGNKAVTTFSATNGTSVIMGGNPLIGWDNFMRGDLITYYNDDKNDFGRIGKIGWTAYGGWNSVFKTAANARVWRVYSAHA